MAQVDKLMFREYDIRGHVNANELNVESVGLIARAFGTILVEKNVLHVVAGHDSRESSEEFHQAMIEGLVECGIHVTDIGLAISPMMYWAQYYLDIPGLAMITGSHNPKEWNGVKLGYDYSSTLVGQEVQDLYDLVVAEKFVTGQGSVTTREGMIEAYAEDLARRVNISRPLKVVVDCGNATASVVGPLVLRKAGVEVVEQFCDLDWSFPNHEPDPSLVESIEALGSGVRAAGADVGIGFDGDGDRLGVADENGEAIWPDRYMILLARQILKEEPGASIVYDVKCSQALGEDIRAHGGNPVMWKTGHSYIKAKLRELGGALGGEMSGHIFYAHGYYGFDDAPYAALKFLEYVASQDQTLSEVIASTPYYVSTPTIHVECPDDVKYKVVDQITEDFRRDYEVIDINGARVEFGDGWGLVRASSNLPALVLRFEARTEQRLEEIQQMFREKLDQFDEVGREWKV